MMSTVRPILRLLNSSQILDIHNASVQILSKTGVRIDSRNARELLVKAGCRNDPGNRIFFTEEIIDYALKSAPDKLDIYNRSGSQKWTIGKDASDQPLFGIGVTNLWFQEDENILPFSRKHSDTAVRLGEALDNYTLISTPGVPQDVPQETADLHSTLLMAANSSKPLIILVSKPDQFIPVLDLLENFFGDLGKNPSVIPYFNPVTPLVLNSELTDQMFAAIERDLPFIFSSYGMAGATTPITPAGTLALLNAELLAGITLSQVVKKGTPVIAGCLPAGFDMRSMTSIYSQQSVLLNLVCAEIMEFYGIPHAGTSGSGPGWDADLLASGILWINHLTSLLGKVGLVPFVGGNFDSLVFSPEMVVYGNQIINEARQFSVGFELNEVEFMFNDIERTGPGGNFLTADSTMELYQVYQHKLEGIWPIYSFETWQDKDRPQADRVLKDYTRELINSLKPPEGYQDMIKSGEALIKKLAKK